MTTTTHRSYGQLCPVAGSLDVVGDRWAMPILRDLLWRGPLRYQQLAELNPGIAPTMLAGRLRQLATDGLIEKLASAGRRRAVYRLTEQGRAIEPVVDALYRFGIDMLTTMPLTADKIAYALMLAARASASPVWELHDHMARVEIDDLAVIVELGPGVANVVGLDRPHTATIRMTQPAFIELVAGAEPTSTIDVTGDQHVADELLALLPYASQR